MIFNKAYLPTYLCNSQVLFPIKTKSYAVYTYFEKELFSNREYVYRSSLSNFIISHYCLYFSILTSVRLSRYSSKIL